MSTEANKVLVHRLYQALNEKDVAALDEILDPNYVDHSLPPGVPPTREGFKQVVGIFRTAFPDFHHTIESLIAEGDKVVVRSTLSGTHTGEFFGIPPTANKVSLAQIHIARVVNGRLIEHWNNEDDLGFMQQLGVVPAMA
jgi:predicted ester cyclase